MIGFAIWMITCAGIPLILGIACYFAKSFKQVAIMVLVFIVPILLIDIYFICKILFFNK